MSVQPLGIVSQAGDGARMTDSPRVTEGCSGIERAVGGVASTAHHTLYSAPPHRHPACQPIVYGDLGSGAVSMKLGSQSSVPNLFGLPASVYADAVPAGAPNTGSTAAACARSAPAARVDKNGTETALQDQRLAICEARLRQEGSVSPVLNAMASANVPHGTEHGQMVYLGADSARNPLRVGETVSPWTHHQECAHRLFACAEQPSVGGHYVSESIPRVNARSVPHYDESSDDKNHQPVFPTQAYSDVHEPGLAHPDVTRGCQERLSHRDWYEAPTRLVPAPLPKQGDFGIPQQPIADKRSVRPYPQVRLAQIQDF